MSSKIKTEWVTCVVNPNYEINTTYPYQIRKKATKRIIKEHEQQGYVKCHLNLKKYSKAFIIAKQFIPNENPEQYTEIDHINHNRSDNHIENLRWVSKSQNCRNKAKYNSLTVQYINELPEDAINIVFYKGIEFENYYYSSSTDKCYYDNGVNVRILPYHNAPSGLKYIRAIDISRKSRCIYIERWKRDEGLI